MNPELIELQSQWNCMLSAEIDSIHFGLLMFIGTPHIAWWRFYLRIRAWMEKWDRRFAGRYLKSPLPRVR